MSDPYEQKFSNLKALTIYRSASHYEISMLFKLLKCCDLEFFHLQEQRPDESLSNSEATDLMLCLQ